MNLLMFNLAVDSEHVTLAFGLNWIRKLALRFDHIDVVTMYEGVYELPSNVTVWSVGGEKNYSKWLRFLNFYLIILKIFTRRKINKVFTHMIPIFAIMFWPISLVTRLKNVMWYAHGAVDSSLKLAHRMVSTVVTSTPEGCRIKSKKIIVIGQGVDVETYKFSKKVLNTEFNIITVGRVAESKNIELIIKAFLSWKLCFHDKKTLYIVGAGTDSNERKYERKLKDYLHITDHTGSVKFLGRKDSDVIYSLLKRSNLFINLSETGSLDKAIVESMASGCPVISSNDSFKAIASKFGFLCCVVDLSIDDIHDKLSVIEAMDIQEFNELVNKQYIATKGHTLDGLINRLVKVIYAS